MLKAELAKQSPTQAERKEKAQWTVLARSQQLRWPL